MDVTTLWPVLEEVYSSEPCARPLIEDLILHLRFGYVRAEPGLFVMGRPVDRRAPYYEITDPRIGFSKPDAWWVYAALGQPRRLVELLPFPLPWIGYERKNEPRFLKTNRFIKLCSIIATPCHPSSP